MVEEFNKLTHEKGMEEYVERFEELKYLMRTLNKYIQQIHFKFH